MKRASLVPYFLASVLLLVGLFSLYVFYESRWLEEELVRQVEVKALALTRTMETSAKKSIKGNALIEELVRQRLLDNARLIDPASHRQRPARRWCSASAPSTNCTRWSSWTSRGGLG